MLLIMSLATLFGGYPAAKKKPGTKRYPKNWGRIISFNPCQGGQYNLGLRPSSGRDSAHGSHQKSPWSGEPVNSFKGIMHTPSNARFSSGAKKNHFKKMGPIKICALKSSSSKPTNMLVILFEHIFVSL